MFGKFGLVLPYPLEVYCCFPLRLHIFIIHHQNQKPKIKIKKKSWNSKNSAKCESPVSSGAVWTADAAERALARSGNGSLCVRPWWEGAKKVRALGSGLKTKREEENEGIEASLRVCKVVPPIPMVFVSVRVGLNFEFEFEERKKELFSANLSSKIL